MFNFGDTIVVIIYGGAHTQLSQVRKLIYLNSKDNFRKSKYSNSKDDFRKSELRYKSRKAGFVRGIGSLKTFGETEIFRKSEWIKLGAL